MLILFKEQTKWLTILDKEPDAEEEHKEKQTTERKQEVHTEGASTHCGPPLAMTVSEPLLDKVT